MLALKPGKLNLLGARRVEELASDFVLPAPKDNFEGAKMEPAGRRRLEDELLEGSNVRGAPGSLELDIFGEIGSFSSSHLEIPTF